MRSPRFLRLPLRLAYGVPLPARVECPTARPGGVVFCGFECTFPRMGLSGAALAPRWATERSRDGLGVWRTPRLLTPRAHRVSVNRRLPDGVFRSGTRGPT